MHIARILVLAGFGSSLLGTLAAQDTPATTDKPAQPDPLAREQLEFVTRIGEGEIARETVTLTATGWTTTGSFDLLGTSKGTFSASLTRADGVSTYTVTKTTDKENKGTAVFTGKELKTTITAGDAKPRERTREFDPRSGVFAIDQLVWGGIIELGRALAACEVEGKLAPGVTFTGMANGTPFPTKLVDATAVPLALGGTQTTLRVCKVELPGNLELILTTSPQGLPLRIDVPAQNLTVVVTGFEDVPGPRGKPTSIVDSGPWREQLSPPAHKVESSKKVMIAMRDGVELAADIYRPKDDGKFPVVLARTPYGRVTESALKGEYYARRGYVFVAQDVRGRGDSGGVWFPFRHEEHDGSDTLDWLAAQPWSDGKIGMIGASYVGLVQWLAAKSGNKHLRCIVPQVSPPDPHENFPYEGGAFLFGAAWWARVLESMKRGTNWSDGVDWAQAYATLPLNDLDSAMNLAEPTFLDEWLAHPPHDPFWEHARYQHKIGAIDIPAFHVTGWWDGDLPGAIMNFPRMRQAAKTAREHQFLVIGPWTHFFNSARKLGDVDYGDEAMVDLDARIVRFFDRYLKDIDNGIERQARVHTFTMGSNRWYGDADWPLPGMTPAKLYLKSGGKAHQRDGDGRLELAPPAATDLAQETYRYDPLDTPAPDVDFTDLSGAQAVADKSGEKDRADDLEFTSPVLETACDLVGPLQVVLYVSTDAADTDFAAAFYRLTRDGKRFAMPGGIQRLRYAADPLRDQPVQPGTVTRVTIDCWAVGQRLEAGDRIQLVIGSSAWPGYTRNLNTLEPQATSKDAVVANNTVYYGGERASYVELPVVPRQDAPGLRLGR